MEIRFRDSSIIITILSLRCLSETRKHENKYLVYRKSRPYLQTAQRQGVKDKLLTNQRPNKSRFFYRRAINASDKIFRIKESGSREDTPEPASTMSSPRSDLMLQGCFFIFRLVTLFKWICVRARDLEICSVNNNSDLLSLLRATTEIKMTKTYPPLTGGLITPL